jgi:hypothetical protein
MQRVLDRESLTQELRVPHQRRTRALELSGEALGRADRYRRLAHQQVALGQVR